jgi:hypothetical protein
MIETFSPYALIKYARAKGKVIKAKQPCFDEYGQRLDKYVYVSVIPRSLLHISGLKSIQCDLSFDYGIYIEQLIF